MTSPLLTLLNAPTVAAYTAAGYWGDETLYAIAARRARATPDRFAVRDRHRRLTYAALVDAADRLAGHLAAQGLRAGERVAVWLPSRIETAIALLACSRNGYVCCPSLHRSHTAVQVAELVDRMRAAALIAQTGYGADGDRNDIFDLLADRREFLRWTCRIGRANGVPFAGALGNATAPPPSADPNQIIYMPFTSGTTGAPKGVLHSDNTLLATARMMARDWRLDGAVLYTLSPLSHNLGLGALVTALTGGGELVIHDLARGESLVDRLEETGAAFLFGVPTHAIDLLAEMRTRGLRRLGQVRGFRIWRCGAGTARRRPYRSRRDAAERLRHDRDLLAPVHPPRRPARSDHRDERACLRWLRIAHLAPGRSRHRSRAGRDRRDRRPRRQPDARLLRRPGSDRGGVQRGGLVHDRRSRTARRGRLSAHHRSQEGCHHPWRP
jgi:acyl-CoA synthetase (AMP-forming)/AMP-acid ligase II